MPCTAQRRDSKSRATGRRCTPPAAAPQSPRGVPRSTHTRRSTHRITATRARRARRREIAQIATPTRRSRARRSHAATRLRRIFENIWPAAEGGCGMRRADARAARASHTPRGAAVAGWSVGARGASRGWDPSRVACRRARTPARGRPRGRFRACGLRHERRRVCPLTRGMFGGRGCVAVRVVWVQRVVDYVI